MPVSIERDDRAASGVDLDRIVVVDVETTGIYNSDRVVEVAAVTVSPSGEILDEWDTLVNPERDVGPTYLHGITASMVSAAPRFEETASALATRLHGAVVVGHNLRFDCRMLMNEYAQAGAEFDPGVGVCTMSRYGGRLEEACARYGISLDHHHRALADARATAELFLAAGADARDSLPATVKNLFTSRLSRTLRRDVFVSAQHQMPYLARLAVALYHRQQRGPHLMYVDMLDRALDDLMISPQEWGELSILAASLGMTTDETRDCHDCYFRELVAAAARDNRITDEEYQLLGRVAHALGLDDHALDDMVARYLVTARVVRLERGMTVCFTGAATYSDGSELDRMVLAEAARSLGMEVVDSVTKRTCHLLVAADPSSQSGKARKARDYGIPVVSVQDFLCAPAGGGVPAC
jgi:DNA polymerase III subunit epsilon